MPPVPYKMDVVVSILVSRCYGRAGVSSPKGPPYVAAGEIAALEHELRDDAVERRSLVTEALLAGAERLEVRGRPRDDVVVQEKIDTARLLC